jgi:hypothetical protein
MQNYEGHGTLSQSLNPSIIVTKINIKKQSQWAWFHSSIQERGRIKCN